MQKKQDLVPQLRFSEFNGVFELKLFDEISDITRLAGYEYSKYWVEDDKKEIIALRGYNIGKGKLELNKLGHISNSLSLQLKRSRLSIGDIVYPCVGSIGNAVVIEENDKYHIQQNIAKITCRSNVYPYYLVQFLISDYGLKEVYRFNASGAQPNVLVGSLRKYRIILPSLKEQQKIANFLTAIDTQIQTLEKKKSLLEQYKKGVMQKIFKQELRVKDDYGNVFPKWSKKKLGDLTYKVGKKNKESVQYPIYSINNQEGFRPQSEQFEGLDSNDRGYDISLYKIVHKETFAYNPARINVGSIGYSYDLKEVIVSSLYVCFKTNKELEDLYLLAYLDTDRFNKDILRYEEGGVRKYLFYDNFSQIKIPLPSNAEQIKIANFLSAIDENIDLVNTKIEQTKVYKKGLLQQMFV